MRSIRTPLSNPELPAIDSTGTLVLCRIGQLAVCLELESGKELWRAPVGSSRFLAGDGPPRALLAAGDYRAVQTVDARTGRILDTNTDAPLLFAGSHGGFTATAAPSGTVMLRPFDPALPRRTLAGHDTQVLALAVHEGAQLAVTADAKGRAKVWDLAARSAAESRLDAAANFIPRSNDALISAAVSGSAQHVATGGWGSVKLWSVETGEEVWTAFPLMKEVRAVAFDARRERIAAGGYDGIVVVLSADTGRELSRSEPFGASISPLLWSPGRDELLCAATDGRVLTLGVPRDGESGVMPTLRTAQFDSRPITSLAVTPGPTPQHDPALAAGGSAGAIWLGAPNAPPLLREPGGAAATVLAFSPDGAALAAGCADGSVQMWDVAARRVVWTIPPSTGGSAASERGVFALAFSRGGRRLVVGGMDAAVHVVDAATGNELLSVPVSGGKVVGLGFGMLDYNLVAASTLEPSGITVLRGDSFGRSAATDDKRVIHEARREVDRLFETRLFSADVVRAIESDGTLREPIRDAALRLARARGDHPNYLNGDAWAAVRIAGRPAPEYELALRRATLACELRPGVYSYLNTLGVAQFRVGRMSEAAATIERCIEMSRARAASAPDSAADPAAAENPLDLCTLAMVRQSLGEHDEARRLLAAARERMKHPPHAQDEECRWFLAEAEAAIASGR